MKTQSREDEVIVVFVVAVVAVVVVVFVVVVVVFVVDVVGVVDVAVLVVVVVVVDDVDHCSGQRDLKINLIYIRKPDLENKGKLVDDYWSPGQQVDPITLVLVPTLIVIFFVLLITIFIFIRCLETSSSWTH